MEFLKVYAITAIPVFRIRRDLVVHDYQHYPSPSGEGRAFE